MSRVNIHVTVSKDLLNKLENAPHNKGIMTYVHGTLARYCNDYIPMRDGNLRKSVAITYKYAEWHTGGKHGGYAHYQWAGVVYSPNYPVFRDGRVVWFYTPKDTHKTPTNRELGIEWEDPVRFPGWTFGYTTPDTGHHWEQIMLAHKGEQFYDEVRRIIVKGVNKS